MIKKTLILATLLTGTTAWAGPVYNTSDYGIVFNKGENVVITPFLQVNANYGQLSGVSGNLRPNTGYVRKSPTSEAVGFDVQLGLNSQLGSRYSIDTALYYSRLGKAKGDYTLTQNVVDDITGDIITTVDKTNLSVPIKGQGIKVGLNIPVADKSFVTPFVGMGYVSQRATVFGERQRVEGGQASVGAGYSYNFNQTIAWNINVEHFLMASGSEIKTSWTGVNSGLRFYFR